MQPQSTSAPAVRQGLSPQRCGRKQRVLIRGCPGAEQEQRRLYENAESVSEWVDGEDGNLDPCECACHQLQDSTFGTRGMVAMVSCPKTMNT